MEKKDLRKIYIHRDLSWLSFNERVLEEAEDARNPLFERLKFMAIFSGNLDEFFMVRVAGIKRLVDAGYNSKDKFGWYPYDLLVETRARTDALLKRLYDLRKKISKDLAKNSIYIKSYEDLDKKQLQFAKRYFEDTVYPVVTPLAVDQGHPFPVLPSRSMSFAVSLTKYNETHLAIINLPKGIPRLVALPSEEGEFAFVLLEDVMRNDLGRFFRGYKLNDSILFRVIRDSELSVEEEYEDDLLRAIESEVKKRPRARVISLEVGGEHTRQLLDMLCESIGFPGGEVRKTSGELDLSYFFELISAVPKSGLFYESFSPAKKSYDNIFDGIKEGEFLVHVPFQSFQPTVDLLRAAASDRDVLAIKMTLYRTNRDSAIVRALKEASANRKQVTVLVELKARFDEETNIQWARELEEAGCHVVYGMPGMKIHSKITLVVRKEEERIRRYVHLSTGNYNEKTAEIYTDYGYFTSNDDFGRDISDVFNVITGYSMPSRWKRIMSAPYDLRQYFMELVDNEIEYQAKYGNGRVFAKMNSLEDVHMIDKIYEASRAGVKVDLMVRGICSLIPGVKGMSENVRVSSIVGRFLEHTRIFLFNNNNDERIFLSSADWMRRNFDRRIELLFEIYNNDLKDGLKKVIGIYGRDNVKTRILARDGSYSRKKKDGPPSNAQEELISYYSGS